MELTVYTVRHVLILAVFGLRVIKNFNHSHLLRVLKDTLTHAPGPGTSNDWSEQQNLTANNSSLVKLQYLWLTLAVLLSFHVTWFKVLKLWKPCTITFAQKKHLSLVPLISGLGSEFLDENLTKSTPLWELMPKSKTLILFSHFIVSLHNFFAVTLFLGILTWIKYLNSQRRFFPI